MSLDLHLPKGVAYLLQDAANRRYVTGFVSSYGFVLITGDTTVFLADSRYYEAAVNTCRPGVDVVLLDGPLWEAIAAQIKAKTITEIWLEGSSSLSFYQGATEALDVPVRLGKEADASLELCRSLKSDEEIRFIRKAQQIAEKAYTELLNVLHIGMTERQVALELEYRMRSFGSEGVSFDTIAVSGKRSSMPHGVPGNKPIEVGDFLTLDFGAVYQGYHSDTTRTVAFGCVTEEQYRVYQTVLEAQLAGCEAVCAGNACRLADQAARRVIEQAGYGDYYKHSTGHGIGLNEHEYPNVSYRSDAVLQKNQAVTVEPGIYLPGRFGVRIEDLLIVKENSSENLTNLDKTLIIL